MTDASLPVWLKALRRHVEQTQTQFAEVVGVHRVTLTKWETGALYPAALQRLRLNDIARDAGFSPIPPKPRRKR